MKKLALLISPLLLMAAAPAGSQTDGIATAISFCGKAMKAYRSGDAGKQAVESALSALDKDTRAGVAVICRAYTTGYDEGQRDFIQNMT